jgi:hypothetical protein
VNPAKADGIQGRRPSLPPSLCPVHESPAVRIEQVGGVRPCRVCLAPTEGGEL